MIFLQILAIIYSFMLPGFLLTRLIRVRWALPLRLLAGLALGGLLVPMLCFCAAWILSTSITWVLTVVVATALNIVLAILALIRMGKGTI